MCVFALYGKPVPQVFVYVCVCTSCRDLATVVYLSIRPPGLEECGWCTTVVLLSPFLGLSPPQHLPVFMSASAEQSSPRER